MNLFRSEGHVRNWRGFKPGTDEGIVPLLDLANLFSLKMFTKRLDPDYVSRYREYLEEFLAAMAELGKARPFWLPRVK